MTPYLLNFSPTGMVPTKQMNSRVPISVSEIVEDVLMAAEYGASIAHLHARDPHTGAPTVDLTVFESIIQGIRQHDKQIILGVSLSGRDVQDPIRRASPLTLSGDVKPDMGSLTLSSLNFVHQASVNAPSVIEHLAARMVETRIAPELEIFDLGMANYVHVLAKKGLLPPRPYANVLLGNIAGAQVTCAHIAAILSNLPPHLCVSLAGLGEQQLSANVMGILCTQGIRIGLEDNLWFDRSTNVPASNETLLKRFVTVADQLGCTPLTPSLARQRLGLAAGDGAYGLHDADVQEGSDDDR